MNTKRYTDYMDKPKWKHDCESCRFLVSVTDRHPGSSRTGRIDIYASCGIDPIIMRFGEDGDYLTTDGTSPTYDHLRDILDWFFPMKRVFDRSKQP